MDPKLAQILETRIQKRKPSTGDGPRIPLKNIHPIAATSNPNNPTW